MAQIGKVKKQQAAKIVMPVKTVYIIKKEVIEQEVINEVRARQKVVKKVVV